MLGRVGRRRLVHVLRTSHSSSSSSASFSSIGLHGEAPVVSVEEDSGVRAVTLNRPRALNALNLPLVRALDERIQQWEPNPLVGVILLQGHGSKAFCAGGDVKMLYDNGKDDATRSKTFEFFREEYNLNYRLATLATPVVSILDGVTMGGGAGISVHGRFRVATDNTLFAFPETKIGLFPDVGASHFLSRLPSGPEVGMWLALTGARLNGPDAVEVGVATHYIPSREECDGLLSSFGGCHDMDDSVIRDVLRAHGKTSPPTWLGDNLDVVRRCFAGDSVEAIVDALKAEAARDGGDGEAQAWAEETLEAMLSCSPLSLKLTFKQLREGAKLDIASCLQMEYRIAQRIMLAGDEADFFEGVRALLVDKDQNPKWRHGDAEAGLAAVSDAEVDAFFAPVVAVDGEEAAAASGGGDADADASSESAAAAVDADGLSELVLPTERGDRIPMGFDVDPLLLVDADEADTSFSAASAARTGGRRKNERRLVHPFVQDEIVAHFASPQDLESRLKHAADADAGEGGEDDAALDAALGELLGDDDLSVRCDPARAEQLAYLGDFTARRHAARRSAATATGSALPPGLVGREWARHDYGIDELAAAEEEKVVYHQ